MEEKEKQKRITKKQRKDFINKNCKIETSDQLSEKFYNVIMNDCYLTCSLSEEKLYSDKSIIDFLIKNSINKVESSFNIHKDEKVKYAVANLGYSEKTNEWWGWSHRAKFHFTIGSEVKVGDVAYVPTNKEDYKNSCLHFWDDEYRKNIHIENETDTKFDIVWTYSDNIPNKKCTGTLGGLTEEFPKKYGRGEWKAKTIEDAKQMAIDFANNIS